MSQEAPVSENELLPGWTEEQTQIANIAVDMFENFEPRYKAILKLLSKKQLLKLSLLLPTYPLKNEDLVGNDKLLNEAFQLGDRINEAKGIMYGLGMQFNMQKNEQQGDTTAEVVNESVVETKE